MVIFDANMILRYLLNDNEEIKETAKRYLITGNASITIEVVAEVIYVLNGVYDMDRKKIAKSMISFMDLVYCNKAEVLRLSLQVYVDNNLDFVDCVPYAYNRIDNNEIATFDKKLLRLLKRNSKPNNLSD